MSRVLAFPFDGVDGVAGEWIDFAAEGLLSCDSQTLGNALAPRHIHRQAHLFVCLFIHPLVFCLCNPGWYRTYYILQTCLEFEILLPDFPSVW